MAPRKTEEADGEQTAQAPPKRSRTATGRQKRDSRGLAAIGAAPVATPVADPVAAAATASPSPAAAPVATLESKTFLKIKNTILEFPT